TTYTFHSAHKSFSSGAAGALKRRSSAAGESFGCALSGTCLSNSARNGSSSRISRAWSCRQISITRFSRSSQAEGNHAVAARRARPFHGHRSTKLIGRYGALRHVLFRSLSRITKNALKHHRHVTHQVHRVIVHDDIPGDFDFLAGRFLFFNGRRFQRGVGKIDDHGGGEFCLFFPAQPTHAKS